MPENTKALGSELNDGLGAPMIEQLIRECENPMIQMHCESELDLLLKNSFSGTWADYHDHMTRKVERLRCALESAMEDRSMLMAPDVMDICREALSMDSILKRTIDNHIEDADMWGDNLPTGDPIQMMGWRPTAYVLAQEVKRLREELDRSNIFLESAKAAFGEHASRLELRIKELEGEAKAIDAQHASVISVWKLEETGWIEENRRYGNALERIADLVADTDTLGDAVSIAVEAMR